MRIALRQAAVAGLVASCLTTGIAAAAPIELIGTGTLPGNASDGLKLVPKILEDGTPHDRVGGFGSALAYTGAGDLYIGVPDRGPFDGRTSYLDRYYLLNIAVTPGGPTPVAVSLVAATLLSNEAGALFTGSTKAFDATNSPASLRLDPEGVRVSRTGTFFVSDEYGPFVYEFSSTGRRLRALELPAKFLIQHPSQDQPDQPTGELPPTNTSGRQANRGMEGLAITPDGTKLYGIMQNALIQDGALNANNSRRGVNNRILEIDVATGATREFLYQLDNRSFGVNEMVAIDDHQFLVIERDGAAGTAAAAKLIFKIDLTGADDISSIAKLPQTGLPDKPGQPGTPVKPVAKTLFLDLLSPAFGLAGATFPEKIEGLAFGPPLPDGRRLLLVASDNDFVVANPSKIFAFAIDAATLPTWQPQTLDARLPLIEQATLWLGLKNSDDQGARFDVRVEVEENGEIVAAGEARCVKNVTRNPAQALAVTVPLSSPSAPSAATVASAVSTIVTVKARMGTTDAGAPCGGHASATGVRLYFDSTAHASRSAEFFLRQDGGRILDTAAPAGAVDRTADAPGLTITGGNPWKVIGTWTRP